jgi:hypothetical protein
MAIWVMRARSNASATHHSLHELFMSSVPQLLDDMNMKGNGSIQQKRTSNQANGGLCHHERADAAC